jgi:hypothetical protein
MNNNQVDGYTGYVPAFEAVRKLTPKTMNQK